MDLSLQMAGGARPPARPAVAVLDALRDRLSEDAAQDVALVVSELVTNSVAHAATGPDETVEVDVDVRESCVHIEVSDDGHAPAPSQLATPPRRAEPARARAGRPAGARVGASSATAPAHTRVWCELPLSRA